MPKSKDNPPPWSWRGFPKAPEDRPRYLIPEDVCGFLGDRYKWTDPQADQLSNEVENFKKKIDRKDKPEWCYRETAVKIFAQHIVQLLKDSFKDFKSSCIMAVPSSKRPDDPEYDNRFEDLFTELNKKMTPPIPIKVPIIVKESTKPAHGGGDRDPADIIKNYTWQGEDLSSIECLIVCDDVITNGGHFRAVSNFLRQNGYDKKIIGLFFGRHRWPDPTDDFKVLENISPSDK